MWSTSFLRLSLRTCIGVASLAAGACGGGLGQSRLNEGSRPDAPELRAPLAVGATMEPGVRLELEGTPSASLRLVSARPNVLAVERGLVVGRAPGVAPLFITTPKGVVLDFYHLWVEQPTHASFQMLDGAGRDLGAARDGIDLLVGEELHLKPRLFFEAQELAGTVGGEWSSDSNVLLVLRLGLSDRRRVVALEPGAAHLSFQSSGLTISLPIRVLAGPHGQGDPA